MFKTLACAVGLGLMAPDIPSAQTVPQISVVATSYINHALDVMQQNSLHRDTIDWTELRRETLERAASSQSVADTYEAIRYALRQLGDHHSFLQLSSADLQAKDKEAREKRKDEGETAGPGEAWPHLLILTDVLHLESWKRSTVSGWRG